jgi:transposase
MEKEENLKLEYHRILTMIKAVNSSTSMIEAARKLGVGKSVLYDAIRFSNLKMNKASCRIERGQKFKYKDEFGNSYVGEYL